MKLSCPSCHARYSIADAKVLGKIVKIRCKRCETIVVADGTPALEDPSYTSAPPLAPTEAAEPQEVAKPGARHEQSVLFSLSALQEARTFQGASGPASDSSGLIDLRRMTAAMQETKERPPASFAVAHLGLGGVFAPDLLTCGSAVAAPVEPSEGPTRGRSRRGLLLAATLGTMTLLVALGVTLHANPRPAPRPPIEAVARTEPSAESSATLVAAAAPRPDPPPSAATAPTPVVGSTASRSRPTTPSKVTRRAPAPSASPAPPVTPATTTANHCCPGETAVTCEMRRAVGSPCATAP